MTLSQLLFPALHKELAEAKKKAFDIEAEYKIREAIADRKSGNIELLSIDIERYKAQIESITAERDNLLESLRHAKMESKNIPLLQDRIAQLTTENDQQYVKLSTECYTIQSSLTAANRRIASLKGTITKLKKKLA